MYKKAFFRSLTYKKGLGILSITVFLVVSYMLTESSWQDYVFQVGALIFAASLLPVALYRSSVIPRGTSVPTSVVLASFVIAFF